MRRRSLWRRRVLKGEQNMLRKTALAAAVLLACCSGKGRGDERGKRLFSLGFFRAFGAGPRGARSGIFL